MRNIPLFTTENGLASLTLEEIPYKSCAYVRIQSTVDGAAFLKECADFCVAVGAEHVYATGDGAEKYPLYNSILQMCRSKAGMPDTDAVLCGVREDTLEKWRDIYNRKMFGVSNAATMTVNKAKSAHKDGGCYFVYRGDLLLGIGMVSGGMISALAAVVSGAGRDVLLALCRAVESDTVCVEFSSTNTTAIKLYNKLGFAEKCCVADWYQII